MQVEFGCIHDLAKIKLENNNDEWIDLFILFYLEDEFIYLSYV